MQVKAAIQQELAQLAPGIPAGLGCPLQVPEGYFEHFALWAATRTATATVTEAQVPAGYFDNFATQLLQKIKSEATTANEEDEVPLVLQQVSKTMPHYLPKGYFAQLPQAIAQQVAPAPAKVVPMGRSKIQLWWAAAAAVVVALALWAVPWDTFTQNQAAYASTEAGIESIDASTMTAYLDTYETEEANFAWYLMQGTEAMEQSIASLPTNDIEAYLAAYPTGGQWQ